MRVHMIDSALFGEQFGTEPMRQIFDDTAIMRSWMQTEAALARAEAAVGVIPQEAAQTISERAAQTNWDPTQLTDSIAETFHPLVPAIRLLADACGEAGAYVQLGAATPDDMGYR